MNELTNAFGLLILTLNMTHQCDNQRIFQGVSIIKPFIPVAFMFCQESSETLMLCKIILELILNSENI